MGITTKPSRNLTNKGGIAIKKGGHAQLFFVSFGQSWLEKLREPALRDEIITDGHAPAQYRALTVRNLDAWYSAFQVKPGQALFPAPEDRVRVW
jgi:putative endopeptidase